MDIKHKRLSVIGFAILLVGLFGVTYSFFNYTREESANNIRTGRIYFNTAEGEALNMTNVFPMSATEANAANLDSVTLGIMGDTTYNDGEEFEITLTNISNTLNNKEIPISYIATYTAANGGTIGESSETYFESRKSKNANIYKLNASGEVAEGKQVLVGYIKKGATGISGTLTIKAYIDADRIAITDTYPEGVVYGYNNEMTQAELTACANNAALSSGFTGTETVAAFCQGTGTRGGKTLSEHLSEGLFDQNQLNSLLAGNIIKELYTNGTPSTWVREREVFTTTEWNSLSANGISFKIKAESQEGIWVEESSKGIESCPDCKFTYTTYQYWTTWNNQGQTPTQITSGLYNNYEELIATTRKNYFLGVKLNNNNEVTNVYTCGVKDNAPFCIEGTSDGSKYTSNQTLINGANLWNNTCTVESDYTECGPWDNSGSLSARAYSYGLVGAGVGIGAYCFVGPYGNFNCIES